MPLAYKRWGRGGGVRAATFRTAPRPQALRQYRARTRAGSMTDSHGQIGMLLTLSAVRSRRHSYHSQADSAGSIPVTRSTREKRCYTYESGAIFHLDRRPSASEISTRAITACH